MMQGSVTSHSWLFSIWKLIYSFKSKMWYECFSRYKFCVIDADTEPDVNAVMRMEQNYCSEHIAVTRLRPSSFFISETCPVSMRHRQVSQVCQNCKQGPLNNNGCHSPRCKPPAMSSDHMTNRIGAVPELHYCAAQNRIEPMPHFRSGRVLCFRHTQPLYSCRASATIDYTNVGGHHCQDQSL